MIQQQWFLVSIENSSEYLNELEQSYSLSKTQPESFAGSNQGSNWLIWLPRIPHVGDAIIFHGYNEYNKMYVSEVVLIADFSSKDGLIETTKDKVAAIISLCSDTNRNHEFLDDNHILRGSVPNFYHWKLQHDDFDQAKNWHSRVRPYVGDCIKVEEQPYQVISLELYDQGSFFDGIIHLKDT